MKRRRVDVVQQACPVLPNELAPILFADAWARLSP
jgi:hypothetical protein